MLTKIKNAKRFVIEEKKLVAGVVVMTAIIAAPAIHFYLTADDAAVLENLNS